MLRKTAKIAFEVAAAIFAGVVVLSALVFWRASTEPISLDFLKTRVAEALTPPGGGKASIGDLSMQWRGWSRLFEVRVTSLRFENEAGGVILFAPSADIALSGPQLLVGEVAPVQISVEQPVLNLERRTDGSYQLYGAVPSDDGPTPGDILAVLQKPTDKGLGGLDRLERFSLRRATVQMRDRGNQFKNLRLSGFDGTFARERDGWRVEARADLTVDGETVEVRGDGNYFYNSRELDGSILFHGLSSELILSHLPHTPADLSVSSRLSGSIAFSLEDFRSLLNVDLVATASDGKVAIGSVLPEPIAYDSLRFQMGYDAVQDTVTLRNLVLERGQTEAMLSGKLHNLANPTVELKVGLKSLPVNDIDGIWPETIYPIARGWVTKNLLNGTITDMSATLNGRIDLENEPKLKDVTVKGELGYEGVTVHFLRPLPPALDVAGRGTFTEQRIDTEVTEGHLDNIQLDGAKVALTGIHTKHDDFATIDADINGPVSDILRLLDHKPFEYAKALDLAPDEVNGHGTGHMHFEMPLLKVMTLDMVDLSATGSFSGVSLPVRTTRLPFKDGELKLDLEKGGMSLDGTGTLSDMPVTLNVMQSFEKKADVRRRIRLAVRPDADKLADLGLDLRRFLDGDVEVDATIEEPRKGGRKIGLLVGLQDADLHIDELGWRKPAGAAGTLRADIRAGDDALTAIDSFQIATGDLAATGSVEFSHKATQSSRLILKRLQIGKTDLSGIIAMDGKGGYTANIEGPVADLTGYVDNFKGAGDAGPDFPLVVSARIDQVLVGKIDPIKNVTLLLENDRDKDLSLAVNGTLGTEPVDLLYSSIDGRPHFELSTKNAGNVLKGFEGFDSIAGGQLAASGTRVERDGRPGWEVSLSVLDFNLVDAPVMAQLLSAVSITGLPAVMQGQGIHFSQMDVVMHVGDKLISLDHLLAQGSALGISGSGTIDREHDTANLNGMIVPAYVLNEIIGSIPLLGTLLTGGEDEGFLAADFKVTGSLQKPEVTVNPLTALTPGIFRNLFRMTGAPPKDPETEDPTESDTRP